MLGHKTSPAKFKNIEIISSIFSDHNAMKLEINHKTTSKYTKMWRLNNLLLNNEWVNNKKKEKINRNNQTGKAADQASRLRKTVVTREHWWQGWLPSLMG